jgi:hypothetical protein
MRRMGDGSRRGVGGAVALGLGLAALACGHAPAPTVITPPAAAAPPLAPVADGALRPPAAFAGIIDREARSRALFGEASRVLLHPRCVNCHPDDDTPAQGDRAALHDPPVARGPDGAGVPGMECASCHQDANAATARVPGAPGWRLAPRAMAWRDRSAAAICAQLVDRARNGGRTLPQLVDHVAHDPLVAWGWAPGAGRTPAPGSQAELAALVSAWIDTGAVCPVDPPRAIAGGAAAGGAR